MTERYVILTVLLVLTAVGIIGMHNVFTSDANAGLDASDYGECFCHIQTNSGDMVVKYQIQGKNNCQSFCKKHYPFETVYGVPGLTVTSS
ncbi:hypothetical protein KY329_00740 [Candidatus Woesearchaeota archaeon]|nr:hypothetical protein [Candidatus Woesearchaeota archaeon]